MTTSAALPLHQEQDNCNGVPVKQSMFLNDNLKDLKNLRKQLYSAADYFELSYTNAEQKQTVADTLKDYTIKAFVNTVDHLGSATYNVNDLVDKRVDEVSGAELQVSCIEQRLQTCHIFINREGLSQQSLVINTPKYHKQYIVQDGETISSFVDTPSKHKECNLDKEHDHQLQRTAAQATTVEGLDNPLPNAGKNRYASPSPHPSLHCRSSSFAGCTRKNERDKRTASPNRFSLLRSGSLSSRPTTPKSSRPQTPNASRAMTPNSCNVRRQYPSELQRSVSMRLHAERQTVRESENQPGKGKRLLRALLSRRKSKKDDMLYTYLDEY